MQVVDEERGSRGSKVLDGQCHLDRVVPEPGESGQARRERGREAFQESRGRRVGDIGSIPGDGIGRAGDELRECGRLAAARRGDDQRQLVRPDLIEEDVDAGAGKRSCMRDPHAGRERVGGTGHSRVVAIRTHI
jgi:hypothetical protein